LYTRFVQLNGENPIVQRIEQEKGGKAKEQDQPSSDKADTCEPDERNEEQDRKTNEKSFGLFG